MKRLPVISLGGGAQSSVLALMASRGAFDRTPDCAIFADTHWEPSSFYTRLKWLEGHLRFPLYVVNNGRSLREDLKALTNHSVSRYYVDIPIYLKGSNGQGDGSAPIAVSASTGSYRPAITGAWLRGERILREEGGEGPW